MEIKQMKQCFLSQKEPLEHALTGGGGAAAGRRPFPGSRFAAAAGRRNAGRTAIGGMRSRMRVGAARRVWAVLRLRIALGRIAAIRAGSARVFAARGRALAGGHRSRSGTTGRLASIFPEIRRLGAASVQTRSAAGICSGSVGIAAGLGGAAGGARRSPIFLRKRGTRAIAHDCGSND